VRIVNLDELDFEVDPTDPEGYRARRARLGWAIAAEQLGASVYELDPGQSICPYHYEYGCDEWLIVLSGSPLLRTPRGEERLQAGDVVCFPDGPEGAHKVTNVEGEALRVAMLSTMDEPAVAVYPDSGKIGVFPLRKLFREVDAVDYWEGEA
jgi:uncharacterized cupin superfamily protein